MEARLNQSGGVNLNVIGTKYKAQSNLWSTEKFWNHRRSIAPSSTRLYWSGAVKINLDIHRSTTLPVFSPAESWVYRDCWVSTYMHSTVLYLISNLAHTQIQNAWFCKHIRSAVIGLAHALCRGTWQARRCVVIVLVLRNSGCTTVYNKSKLTVTEAHTIILHGVRSGMPK